MTLYHPTPPSFHPTIFAFYNTDFVRENLKFLYNKDEDIESFALVGVDNNRLQPRIDEITQILGSVDSGVGTLFDEDKDTKALGIAKTGLKIKKDALSKKLTDKANVEIKANPSFVKQGKNYNVSIIPFLLFPSQQV